ncbi:MAG: DeoR/GlpR transcriptional regulator [Chloroflexi bacterium]|nr:DeoR/GlpR transcriptional regulator [Chloroflexota bacterium]
MDLLKAERQQRVLDAIRTAGRATVAELSERFAVSEVTVRRDLAELAEHGAIQRAHGGAIARSSSAPQPPVVQRMADLQGCKVRIAQAAARLVDDGDSVFIGSGTTTAHVARELAGRRKLTVVTNALNVAMEFAVSAGVTVVVTGGMMRESELSLIGHITEQSLREVRVDKVIIGMRAISLERGMTNDYLPEVMTDRAIIEMAETLIVVADHSKFGQTSSAYVAPVERISTLVTDEQIDPELVNQLVHLGIAVIVAEA